MEEDALCEEPKEALIMTIELSRLDAINNLLQRVEYKHEMSILILRKTASSQKLSELPSAASPKKLPLPSKYIYEERQFFEPHNATYSLRFRKLLESCLPPPILLHQIFYFKLSTHLMKNCGCESFFSFSIRSSIKKRRWVKNPLSNT